MSKKRFLGRAGENKRGERKLEFAFIPVDKIDPNPYQVRKRFDEESLKELAESIKHQKVLHPVLVRRRGDRYELIVGERRWRASKIAGEKEIPAFILDVTDVEQAEMSLAENLHREDLSGLEKAEAVLQIFRLNNVRADVDKIIQSLINLNILLAKQFGGNKNRLQKWLRNKFYMKSRQNADLIKRIYEICERIGKSYKTILDWLKITTLPDEIKDVEWRKKKPTDWNILARIADVRFRMKESKLDDNLIKKIQLALYKKIEEEKIVSPKNISLQSFMGRVVTSITNLLRAGGLEEVERLLKEGVEITEERLQKMEIILGLYGEGEEELKKEMLESLDAIPSERVKEIVDFIQKTKDKIPKEIAVKVVRGELQPKVVETIIKEVPEDVRAPIFERIVKGELVGSALEKTVDVVIKEEVPEIVKQMVAVGEASPSRVMEVLEVVPEEVEEVIGEKLEKVVKAWDEMAEAVEKFRSRPEYDELKRLEMTYYLHLRISSALKGLTCPICGNDWTHLRWDCHGLNVVEARQVAWEKYKEIAGGEKRDKIVVEVSDGGKKR